ncbi:MAG: hypothetical protein IPH53_10320 [Flavobacteriales bacterium]|nr:hypothetical protein [Flavobacteriales bacterium]
MRTLLLLAFALLMSTGLLAQSHGLTYQAVILDSESNITEIPGADIPGGNYLPNKALSLKFTILNEFGGIDYQEEHSTTTDLYGMISVIIGDGAMTSESPDVFMEISWDGTPKDLRVEVSIAPPNGTGNFEFFSLEKLVFVPYAYHRNITATGTMDIDGATTLNSSLDVTNGSPTHLTGDLTVDGSTNLNNGLNVNNQSPTDLSGTLTVDGVTNLNNGLNVNNGSPTYLSGTLTVEECLYLNDCLDVDGTTDLNNGLDVNNNTPTNLTGTLNVDGAADLNNTLTVDGATDLNSTLNVEALATMESDLVVIGNATIGEDVRVGAQTDMGRLNVNTNGWSNVASVIKGRAGDLDILELTSSNGTDVMTVGDDGYVAIHPGTQQVVIDGPASGGANNNTGSYPLYVRGAQQGIAIKLNTTEAHEGNDYLYFTDNSYIRGSVAGQNLSELQTSFDYIWFNTMAALDEAFILAEGVACGFQLDAGEVAVMAAQGLTVYLQWAEAFYDMETNVGVVYQSNSADYAEWLERADPGTDLLPGTVVGVVGGRISKNTDNAQQFMVVSSAPMVLGNTPPSGREKDFEKVAFMGQVPVRVVGQAHIGDFIVASGRNDGTARGVAPEAMTLDDYDHVVGVAWSDAIFTQGESLVNTSVGGSSNHLVASLKKQKQEVDRLQSTLDGVVAYLKAKDPAFDAGTTAPAGSAAQAAPKSTLTPASTAVPRDHKWIEGFLRENPQVLIDVLERAKAECARRGMDVNDPIASKLFDKEAFMARLAKVDRPIVRKPPTPVGEDEKVRPARR